MINLIEIIKILKKEKIKNVTGVPDSNLKNLINNFTKDKYFNNFISANEGSAVAYAIGNYLYKKQFSIVYLQNSGLGNAINPLISLANKYVYNIPIILFVGWRGSPGSIDEPQHFFNGKVTPGFFKLLNIKYKIIKSEKDLKSLKTLIKFSKNNNKTVAVLFPNGLFNKKENINDKEKKLKINRNKNLIQRSEAISILLHSIKKKTNLISSTGYLSRQLYQLRKNFCFKNSQDFYLVGGMGHTSMIALSLSIRTKRETVVLEGDGSSLMHLGSLASCGVFGRKNFKYILFNNGIHESVGGQKTLAQDINFKIISKGFKFKNYFFADRLDNYKKIIKNFLNSKGPSFLELIIQPTNQNKLLRINNLNKIKEEFINEYSNKE